MKWSSGKKRTISTRTPQCIQSLCTVAAAKNFTTCWNTHGIAPFEALMVKRTAPPCPTHREKVLSIIFIASYRRFSYKRKISTYQIEKTAAGSTLTRPWI